jgi:spore coat polysaccharide biosynthesis protein SpsF (cytidylyltransferase family)
LKDWFSVHLNKKTALTIQARLGSTRLPGKVLHNLAGKPMFEQIYNQVKHAQKVQSFCLNTSDAESDDKLVTFAKGLGLQIFRGPVDDIVSRLAGAMNVCAADHLVRIWGDCPFVCPDVIDDMLAVMFENDLHFVHNSDIANRTFPPGLDVEIYRRDLLMAMNAEVTDPKLREFPVEFVKKNLQRFSMRLFPSPVDLSHTHLTVDYPADMKAAEILLNRLHQKKAHFGYQDLQDVLKNSSDIEFSQEARNIEYQKFLQETAKESK